MLNEKLGRFNYVLTDYNKERTMRLEKDGKELH